MMNRGQGADFDRLHGSRHHRGHLDRHKSRKFRRVHDVVRPRPNFHHAQHVESEKIEPTRWQDRESLVSAVANKIPPPQDLPVRLPPQQDRMTQHNNSAGAQKLWHQVVAMHGEVAVVWRAAVGCDFSGFFIEVLGLLPALVSHIPSFYLDIGECRPGMLEALDKNEREVLQKLQGRSHNIIDRLVLNNTPYMLVQHKLPQSPFLVPGGNVIAHVGRTMSETAVVSPLEVIQDSTEDELWVPTQWHVNVFEHAGISRNKLVVIPEAVDLDFFSPTKTRPALDARVDSSFKFLAVAKWEHRKGFDVLLRAFWEEFEPETRTSVKLQLRTYKPAWEIGSEILTDQFADLARMTMNKQLDELPSVSWIKEDLTRKQLRDLYQDSDAFVLPTRGEGWGLPIVEAMSMGLPTIATNFSGPTAYLNEDTGFPVTFALNADGTAEPDVAHLRKQMRKVFAERALAKSIGLVGQKFIKDHYGSVNVGSMVVKRLAALALAHPAS